MRREPAFPVRHRGAYVPDHVRRLEEISLASPRATRRFSDAEDRECAAFFRGLAVWVDQALGAATAHAGFDKVHLYLAVLRGVVDELVPHAALARVVEDLEDYVAYLSSPPSAQDEPQPTPRRPAKPSAQGVAGVASPRAAVALGAKRVLSPRVLRAMAKDAAPEAALSSPRISKKRPKKIIELSDHEEAVLEVALFFQEALAQLSNAASRLTTTKRMPTAASSHRATPLLTQQWLLCDTMKRTHTLKKLKHKIATHTLFPSSNFGVAHGTGTPATPSGGSRLASGGPHSPSSAPPPPTVSLTHLDLARYFSLLVLCFQETTRRVGVFSAEIAAFLWTNVTHQTLEAVEALLQEVLARQQRAQRELERLRASRNSVLDAIAHCEHEIQRLQAQNMRSLAVWELERAEMTTLEQEEAWHGHCKALVYRTLRALQADASHATWFQLGGLRDEPPATGEKETDATSTPESTTPAETAAGGPVSYQRLPAGAALLHSRLRGRVAYVTHLLVLCRSFLHLHEKRALREVMEATSTNPRWTDRSTSPQATMLDPSGGDSLHPQPHSHGGGTAMERISATELRTLRDINDALRAIEELYAASGGSGDHGGAAAPSSSLMLVARGRGRDATTQFPVVDLDASEPAAAYGFLRALAHSTVVAGGSSATRVPNTPAFVRAGMTATGGRRGPRRRNAELGFVRTPMGSGRRLTSAASSSSLPEPSQAPTQPLLRLNKAVAKLPRHLRDVLILPLLQSEPFPAELASSIVESLTRDEILARIQWLYDAVLDATTAAPASTGSGGSTPIPLARHLWTSWNSEQFVAFVHAAFLDRFGAGDVARGERQYVRLFASIQLLFSGLGEVLAPASASASGSGLGASQAMDKIGFFARLTQLLPLEAPDAVTGTRLPAPLFPVFFHCLFVLQQVAVTRKLIDEGGLTIDVWTVPVATPATSPSAAPAASPPPRSNRVRGMTLAAAATPSPEVFRSHTVHAGQFVLLESVKALLTHLLEGTSPDAAAVVAERVQFLTDRASAAKVALLSSVVPGAYELHGAGGSATGMSPAIANGELVDALILPLDFAVLTLASAWLQQHAALVERLSVAMRAASAAPSGELSFDEFTHVMLVGAAAPPSSVASAVRAGQLTQIYAALLARGGSTGNRGAARGSASSVSWQALIVAVVDEIDLLGVRERLALVDMRSIHQAMLRGSGNGSANGTGRAAAATPWVARPAYRGGDAPALRRAWGVNRAAMRDHFALAFQSEHALEGVALWQTGAARMDRVEALLAGHHHNPDMSADELAVAWRALYYLQLDHAQAAHVAEGVRVRQLRGGHTKPT